MSRLFASGGQSIGASASASVLPINIQGWFLSGLIGLVSLQSKGLSRAFSNTTVQKHLFFGAQPCLWSNEVKAGLKQFWEGLGYKKWRKLAEKVFIRIFFLEGKEKCMMIAHVKFKGLFLYSFFLVFPSTLPPFLPSFNLSFLSEFLVQISTFVCDGKDILKWKVRNWWFRRQSGQLLNNCLWIMAEMGSTAAVESLVLERNPDSFSIMTLVKTEWLAERQVAW